MSSPPAARRMASLLLMMGLSSACGKNDNPSNLRVANRTVKDKGTDVYSEAAQSLRETDSLDKKANTPLCDDLSKDAQDPEVCFTAARALGTTRPVTNETVHALVRASTNANPRVRVGAIGALGEIGLNAKETLPTLITALRKDTDSNVRRWSAYGIGELGPTANEAVPALISALKDDDMVVRLETMNSLGKMGSAASDATNQLEPFLKDISTFEDAWECVSAYQALTKIGTSDAKKIASRYSKQVDDCRSTLKKH